MFIGTTICRLLSMFQCLRIICISRGILVYTKMFSKPKGTATSHLIFQSYSQYFLEWISLGFIIIGFLYKTIAGTVSQSIDQTLLQSPDSIQANQSLSSRRLQLPWLELIGFWVALCFQYRGGALNKSQPTLSQRHNLCLKKLIHCFCVKCINLSVKLYCVSWTWTQHRFS